MAEWQYNDGGIIGLGFDCTHDYPSNLDFGISDLYSISPHAFAHNLKSNFYSCNTGTAGDESFARYWVNRFGGSGIAFRGKTDYTFITDSSFLGKIGRKLRGIPYGGKVIFPIGGEDAEELSFCACGW